MLGFSTNVMQKSSMRCISPTFPEYRVKESFHKAAYPGMGKSRDKIYRDRKEEKTGEKNKPKIKIEFSFPHL